MFKSLYRKYRPQTFSDVVGQKHVVSVLQSAIVQKKIAHAYIFYGSRGTGKTSLAKIFANEVNNNAEYLSDSVDIIEIDAASNNGVDEIRDLKEAIKFSPTQSKYKVYIIDEVHMLTTSAFNALLKTLEEPPAHIIFILATTEIHKIPATILSRCQKFEFKNISQAELVERLNYIAEKENIRAEKDALIKIAQVAKGGLRDAIGILEQASNYNLEKISLSDILALTSSVGEEEILNFYRLILENNSSQALLEYSKFLELGKDTKLLLSDLINVSRDIIIYKNINNKDFCEYRVEELAEVLKNISTERIYKNIEELASAENNIRFSTEYISYMQICIIKMCQTPAEKMENKKLDNSKIELLEKRIQDLEEKLNNINLASINTNSKNIDDVVEKNDVEDEGIEKLDSYFIPNRKKIENLILNSNDKFTIYARNVFSKILKESSTINGDISNVFKNSDFLSSSKNGGLIVLNNSLDIFKVSSDAKYKDYLENSFSKLLDVEYSIYILQKEQYEYLLENMNMSKEENLEEESLVEEKKENTLKIENLFSDIIVEK
ncbi:DNA polymerase III subunit gamma/tau [Gemella sp. zg-1178]|uniref:DNA polymerase III subunit gamma/tau n=1 Tax=Gemella sp. zg-1178 TaxID=2840372 RepID=UPI001C04ACF7|nr:DNA polymerase III subunit gamma/tau [Gemella sp. zg-1178]MBU0278028.1 DNA polymerase III subunit gamma/tau [Gemella sp. zg-1178]